MNAQAQVGAQVNKKTFLSWALPQSLNSEAGPHLYTRWLDKIRTKSNYKEESGKNPSVLILNTRTSTYQGGLLIVPGSLKEEENSFQASCYHPLFSGKFLLQATRNKDQPELSEFSIIQTELSSFEPHTVELYLPQNEVEGKKLFQLYENYEKRLRGKSKNNNTLLMLSSKDCISISQIGVKVFENSFAEIPGGVKVSFTIGFSDEVFELVVYKDKPSYVKRIS